MESREYTYANLFLTNQIVKDIYLHKIELDPQRPTNFKEHYIFRTLKPYQDRIPAYSLVHVVIDEKTPHHALFTYVAYEETLPIEFWLLQRCQTFSVNMLC